MVGPLCYGGLTKGGRSPPRSGVQRQKALALRFAPLLIPPHVAVFLPTYPMEPPGMCPALPPGQFGPRSIPPGRAGDGGCEDGHGSGFGADASGPRSFIIQRRPNCDITAQMGRRIAPPRGGQIIRDTVLPGLRSDPADPQRKNPNYCSNPLKAVYGRFTLIALSIIMARSKSKNKTLAVGESVHARVTEIQALLGLKNHDDTIRVLLDSYCSNPDPKKAG